MTCLLESLHAKVGKSITNYKKLEYMKKLVLTFFIVLGLIPAKAQLIQHLDATVKESIKLDASNKVTEWIDQSGKNNNAISATGKVIVTNTSPNWLDFGPANNTMELFSSTESDAWLDQSAGTGGFCVMIAFKINDFISNINDLIGNTSSNKAGGFGMRYSNNKTFQIYLGNKSYDIKTSLNPGDSVVFALNYNASARELKFWDSKNKTYLSGDTNIDPADFSLNQAVTIGGMGSGGRYINGFIGEVKVYARALSLAEFESEKNQMAQKWAGYVPPVSLNWQVIPEDNRYPTGDVILSAISADDKRLRNPLPADPANTDCSATLQEAIDIVNANGGGTVFIPEGEYRCDHKLEVKSGVTLRGRWDKPSENGWNPGTVLKVYYGRNKPDTVAFLNFSGENTAIRDLTFWYPEQSPDNVVPYPYTVNGPFTVENITFVNAYRGLNLLISAMRVVRGLYGTILETGLVAAQGYAVPRWRSIYMGPQYWEWWPLDNAVAQREIPGNYANYMFNNGFAFRVRNQDCFSFYNADISGYSMGLVMEDELGGGSDGATSPLHGQVSNVNIHDCKTAIHVKNGTFSTGLKSNFSGTEYGIYSDINGDIPLVECTVSGGKKAVYSNNSALKVSMRKCEIQGLVEFTRGEIELSACNFTSAGPHLKVTGGVTYATAKGCTNNGAPQITIEGEQYMNKIDHNPINFKDLPDYKINDLTDWNRHRKPIKQDLFNVADYGVVGDGLTDDTQAVLDALAAAKANGGGIVFFPYGKYRITENLNLGSGIELRGIAGSRVVPQNNSEIALSTILVEKQGTADGNPFISMGDNSGVQELCFFYPGNNMDRIVNKNEKFTPYPYTIQATGENNWVVNCASPNPYQFLDMNGAIEPLAELNLLGGIHNTFRVRGGTRDARIQVSHVKPAAMWGTLPDVFANNTVQDKIRLHTARELIIFDLEDASNITLNDMFGRAAHMLVSIDGTSGRSLGVSGEALQNGFVYKKAGSDPFYMIDTKPNPYMLGDETGQADILLEKTVNDTVYAFGGADQGSGDYKFKVLSGHLYVQTRKNVNSGTFKLREIFVGHNGQITLNDVIFDRKNTLVIEEGGKLKMENCKFTEGLPYTNVKGSLEIGKNCSINGNYIVSSPGQWQFTEHGLRLDTLLTSRKKLETSWAQKLSGRTSFNLDVTEPAYQDGKVSYIEFDIHIWVAPLSTVEVYYMSATGEKLGIRKSFISDDRSSQYIKFSVNDAKFNSDVDIRIVPSSGDASLSYVAVKANVPLEAPTVLTAADGDNIVLNWSGKTNYQFNSYNLYRAETSGGPYQPLAPGIVNTNYLDTHVTIGKTYYYVVRTLDNNGTESDNSNEASATVRTDFVADTIPPVKPLNLSATASDGVVSLDWDDYADNDFDGYFVYRSTSQGLDYQQVNKQIIGASEFTDSTVTNGTTYYYVVTAYDKSSNESGTSNEAEATPQKATSVFSPAVGSEMPDIFVYPNPSFNDFITIETRNMSGDVNFFISNQEGRLVYQGKLPEKINEIAVNRLPAGIYIVTVIDDKKSFHSKLIIQNKL